MFNFKIRAHFSLVMAVLMAALTASTAQAYLMYQNQTTGTVTGGGAFVSCNDADGFTHWTIRNIVWRVNSGSISANATSGVDHAIDQWNNVSGSDYQLLRGTSTSADVAVDGDNTLVWTTGNGCFVGCLALTALTLQADQVIVESDITFNTFYNWTTSNTNYDIRAQATHELGHSLGIGHSDHTPIFNKPSMRAVYHDNARSLENDDEDALRCSVNTYPAICTDPCPAGGHYDGANCYMWSVPGNIPFIFDGKFYYGKVEHPNGPCPHPVLDMINQTATLPTFDTQNCRIASANGAPNPFIWDNKYYIAAEPPPNRCPYGGTYDGSSCYMFHWPGVDPFIYREGMYYDHVSHPLGPCPHDAHNVVNFDSATPTSDGVHCVVRPSQGGNQLPFLYNNRYYLTPVCHP